MESIELNALNLCTASCVSTDGATILGIPRHALHLFPKPFELEIRALALQHALDLKDKEAAFKLQYRARLCENAKNLTATAKDSQKHSSLSNLSMQRILECGPRSLDQLAVRRRDPLFERRELRHIETLSAAAFGPLHLRALALTKQSADSDRKRQLQRRQKRKTRRVVSRRSVRQKQNTPSSLASLALKMTSPKYEEHDTKHRMRRDSRFLSNKCLRAMAEKRAKQTFVIRKIYRVHREPVDVDAMPHRQGFRGRSGGIDLATTDRTVTL